MKFLTAILLLHLFSVGYACLKENESCSSNSECCSGICSEGQCAVRCEDKLNPCDQILCPAGEICVLKQVYCIRAPCPPLPVCVKTATV